MATEDYMPDPLATLAREAARKVGCQAQRWWQDTHNPRRLYIELTYTLSDGQSFPVWVSTLLPGHVEGSHHADAHGELDGEAQV
jgi:hypothetical protein